MNISLVDPWNQFWGALKSSFGNDTFITVMAVIGVVLILFGIIAFAWQKRRGGGGDSKKLIISIIVGVILAAPEFLIPVILKATEVIVNIIAGVFQRIIG